MGRTRLLRCVTLSAGLLALGACSSTADTRPARQPTHGKVTYNGQPAGGALVMLWPVPVKKDDYKQVKPQGIAAADGTFKLISYDPDDGAPAGEYAVTVRWSGPGAPPGPDLLKDRYSDPNKPVTKVTIKDGQNEIPPIQLTGPAVKTGNQKGSGD